MDLRIYRILAVIEAKPLCAVEVMEALRADGGTDVPSIPSFYRLLKQELDEGNLEIMCTISDGGRGRPQHVYRLTPAGRDVVREQANRLQMLASLVLHPEAEESK